MPCQTYCVKADIEAIWPPASLLASVDDDSSGTLSATEEGYITRAIERAANLINVAAGNAIHAGRPGRQHLVPRRQRRDRGLLARRLAAAAAAPAHLSSNTTPTSPTLADIAAGHLKVPEAAESFDASARASRNFAIDHEPRTEGRRVEDEPGPNAGPGASRRATDSNRVICRMRTVSPSDYLATSPLCRISGTRFGPG